MPELDNATVSGGTIRAYSINGFCHAYGISRPMFYKLRKQGRGPKIMKIGDRTLISVEAADTWRKEMEGSSTGDEAA